MSIRTITRNVRAIKSRATNNRWHILGTTPPQYAWMRDSSKIKLLLGGNQVGKTMAACAELIHRCLGTHPYIQTDPPPIQAFLITHSHQQSITIQEKLIQHVPQT